MTAAANRRFADEHGGVLVLRIDDTDAARRNPQAEGEILGDLEWLGIRWDEGPVRQSERGDLYRAAAARLLSADAASTDPDGSVRFRGRQRRLTLIRADGTATYHLASVVDDGELGITHVIRGKDLLPATSFHAELAGALGLSSPEYIHHGLLVGDDGRKLSKRHGASSVADLRDEGVPAEAVRAYLDELDMPRSDVHLDPARLQRLSVEAIAAMPDDELAARAGAERRLVPVMRGARSLVEARDYARQLSDVPEPPELDEKGRLTLERFRELRTAAPVALDEEGARSLVREVKAVGGDLRALRRALTGRDRGPELWAVILALPGTDALQRIDAAL
jgi:glutamyl-tRNA synthetase